MDDIEREDLIPCPFCGSKTVLTSNPHGYDGNDSWAAWCNGCGANIAGEKSQDQAAAAWNRRFPERVELKGVKFPEGTYHLENQAAFQHGGDGHHVLRLIANEQITADKGAEWIREILMGDKPELPPFTVGPPESHK